MPATKSSRPPTGSPRFSARRVRERMKQLKERFPPGIDYAIVYDTTPFINESIVEVFETLFDAIAYKAPVSATVAVLNLNARVKSIPPW